MSMRARRAIHHVLGPASPLLIAAAVTAVPSAPAEAMTARATPAAVVTGTGVLDDVVAVTATNAWAVGHDGDLANPKTLIEHWNGTAWHRVSVRPAAGWLNGVAATSARDVWAVGLSGTRALILHFNGTAWRRVAGPAVGTAFTLLVAVTAISPRCAEARGARDAGLPRALARGRARGRALGGRPIGADGPSLGRLWPPGPGRAWSAGRPQPSRRSPPAAPPRGGGSAPGPPPAAGCSSG